MLVFFIIGLGRSGQTAWAKKFGFLIERNWYHASPGKIKRRIAKAKERGEKVYGEVSFFHLRIMKQLKEHFPDAFFIHNVRNGKDCVTSLYCIKKIYHPTWMGLEDIIEGFNEMGKFEKVCWMWKYWNEEADRLIPTRVRVEDFEQTLGIGNPDEPKKSIMKHNDPWTKEQEDTFERICGSLHRKYGYDKRYSYGI